jgi:hypothetical protein
MTSTSGKAALIASTKPFSIKVLVSG